MHKRYWQAIVNNDAAYDGTFYYAVATTGIFCRPSCKSRLPKREHVRIFLHQQAAIAESFRPCKRCRPDGVRLPDEEWVAQMKAHMEEHFAQPLTLGLLSEQFYASTYHLQRTFKRVAGVTPLTYIQQVRLAAAKKLLITSDLPIQQIGVQVGMPNAAHFATLFQKRIGLTPTEFRAQHVVHLP